MKVVNGDIIKLALNGEIDVLVHGCNCFCTMGAGIAKEVRKAFMDAELADKETKPGDHGKLGGLTYVEVSIGLPKPVVIVNAYTQYNYGKDNLQYVDYAAVRSIMKIVKREFTGLKIAYPKIGAGYGGGDWDIIEKIIDEELKDEDHTLVILDKQ